jgi:hypothetical protein
MMWTDHGHQDFYRNRQSGHERPGLAIQRVAEDHTPDFHVLVGGLDHIGRRFGQRAERLGGILVGGRCRSWIDWSGSSPLAD